MPGFDPVLKIRKQYSVRGQILRLARLLRISPADSRSVHTANRLNPEQGLGIGGFWEGRLLSPPWPSKAPARQRFSPVNTRVKR